MTGQQQYLRLVARRIGLFYCANCGEEPPIPDRSLCERCSLNRSSDLRARRHQKKAIDGMLRDA